MKDDKKICSEIPRKRSQSRDCRISHILRAGSSMPFRFGLK